MKTIRYLHDLNQELLAERANLSLSRYVEIETGGVAATNKEKARICQALAGGRPYALNLIFGDKKRALKKPKPGDWYFVERVHGKEDEELPF